MEVIGQGEAVTTVPARPGDHGATAIGHRSPIALHLYFRFALRAKSFV
jgi:hypothetical protein